MTVSPSDSVSGVTTQWVKWNNPEIHSTSTKSQAQLSCGAVRVCEFTAGLLFPRLSGWIDGGAGACTCEVTPECFPMLPKHALNSMCSRHRNVTHSAWGTPEVTSTDSGGLVYQLLKAKESSCSLFSENQFPFHLTSFLLISGFLKHWFTQKWGRANDNSSHVVPNQ